jgi:hypothetical protein
MRITADDAQAAGVGVVNVEFQTGKRLRLQLADQTPFPPNAVDHRLAVVSLNE